MSEKEGREQFISFLKKKLKLPVSWAWNGVSIQENMNYKKYLEEAIEDMRIFERKKSEEEEVTIG